MITSASNAQIKKIIQLNKSAKVRRKEGLFVLEGRKLFQETPGEFRRRVYLMESRADDYREMTEGVEETELVSDEVFRRMSDTMTPQGILTVSAMPSYSLTDLLGDGSCPPLILVLEDVQDPGNVGTMIRTAEGAGVTGILMSSGTADVFQPKVTRSTMGSIFRVPFLRVDNLKESVMKLKEAGIRTFAAHLKGENDCFEEDYTGPAAFLIGNEGNGLSGALTELADTLIRIPMQGKVESLNASIAAALLMYEAERQRLHNYK